MKRMLRWLWLLPVLLLGLLAALAARHRRACLGAAAGILAAAGVAWGARAVNRSLAAAPAFALSSAPISLSDLPAFLDPAILPVLHREHIAPLMASAVDRDAAAAVARALAASPWVRSVASVDVDTTPRISVSLVFREPVARVAWGRGTGWVDADGVLLPMAHYRVDAREKPLIIGVRAAPPKVAGACWGDPGLAAGLAVLARFRSDEGLRGNLATALETIDVSNLGERRGDLPEVVCRTRQRLSLRFSVSGKPGRATLDEQMGRLKQVLTVDRNLALARNWVDLRFERPVGS